MPPLYLKMHQRDQCIRELKDMTQQITDASYAMEDDELMRLVEGMRAVKLELCKPSPSQALFMEGVAPQKGSRAEKRAQVSRGGPISARTGLPIKNFGMNTKARPKRKGDFVRGKVLEAQRVQFLED